MARRYAEPSGAGNYVVIDHGGGWTTYYFHLSAYSVPDGAYVEQGQQIGVTGSTGNSSGPHVHYEQLYNGVGQSIVINGVSLAPYPSQYNQKYLVSDNCGAGGGGVVGIWRVRRRISVVTARTTSSRSTREPSTTCTSPPQPDHRSPAPR